MRALPLRPVFAWLEDHRLVQSRLPLRQVLAAGHARRHDRLRLAACDRRVDRDGRP